MNWKMPYDRGLLLIVFALLGFGLIMVFSTSSVVSGDTGVFARHFLLMIVGLLAMLAGMTIDYRLYGHRYVVIALLVSTYLLLGAVLAAPQVNNVHRWLVAGPFRFQPSELAKVVMVLFTAYFIASRRSQINSLTKGLAVYGAVVGSVLVLVLAEPDFGTTACIAITAALLLYVGGLHYRYFLVLFLVALPSFYFLVYNVPYRRSRILAFLDPEQNPLGSGYQIRQSLIAVGSGGMQGLGFAQSRQKLSFLPEAHTDFIFAILGEELGLMGCATLLILFLLLFWRGVRIALRADTELGTLMGLGIIAMIVVQALINMSVVLALLPTKGIPLPFISVGGSSMLMMLLGLGILLNISKYARARGGSWEPLYRQN